MNFSAYNIPYPKPGCEKGEDYIVVRNTKDKITCLVIDGVSGSSVRIGPEKNWIQCRDFVVAFGKVFKREAYQSLSRMINISLDKTVQKYPGLQGTFVFVCCQIEKIEGVYLLDFCYAGDASLFIVRDQKVIYKTKPMYVMKRENVPAQIGVYQGNIQKTKFKSGDYILQSKDRIILCSDGVTDNLSDETIIKCKSGYELVQKAYRTNKKRDDISGIVITLP